MRNLSVIYLADKKSNLNAKTIDMAYKFARNDQVVFRFLPTDFAIQTKPRAYYFNFPQ